MNIWKETTGWPKTMSQDLGNNFTFPRLSKTKTKSVFPFVSTDLWSQQTFKWENCASTHRFLHFWSYLDAWLGIIKVSKWNGLKFSVHNTYGKSKLEFPEQIWAKNPYVKFFGFNLYINSNHSGKDSAIISAFQD